jgi:hypothetical protein
LPPFRDFCEYPRRIGCGTPFVCRDKEQLKNQSRQVLFSILPLDSQNSLNALQSGDRVFIFDNALDRVMGEYENRVRVLESELFDFLRQSRGLDRLEFRSEEIDQAADSTLRQSLSDSLKQKLNLFCPAIQKALLNSAYCQLKGRATGSENTIYC